MTVSYVERSERLQLPYAGSPFHRWLEADGCVRAEFFRGVNSYLVRLPDLADFEISTDGSEAVGHKVPGVSASTVEHLFLNVVTPLSLSRQGKLVLHAGAVEIDGEAVAFVGPAGRGKSTLTASFALSGHRFLTDDALQLELENGRAKVFPSHPSIRLWADSESTLMPGQPKAAPVDYTDKARFLAGAALRHCNEQRPLRCVYFVGDHPTREAKIEPVAAATAMIELVKNSFVLDIEAAELLEHQFNTLSALATLPMFYSLNYPRSYTDLPLVRDAILGHSASKGTTQ